VALFRDPRLATLISRVVEQERIDIIDSFLIRPFLSVIDQACPVVVDLIDSMQLNVQRRLHTEPLWMRPVLALEALRLREYEPHVCSAAAASLVVANADKDSISGPRLFVVPLGVDDAEFYPSATTRVRRRVVFSGNMSYHANKAALRWFVRSCWPRIHEQFTDAELCVAGHGSDRLKGTYAGTPGIHIVGRVRSMGDFLRTADISIAPMCSGSGMQNKVLEAMACGLPTVVSPLGLGDIKAASGVHTLVAASDSEFISAIRSLFSDEGLHRALSRAAIDLVKTTYSWSRNAAEFERIAIDCISARTASRDAA
jgi:glycosyltransferase involved in cell wall biosynthesis